jgi:hypothetical protein
MSELQVIESALSRTARRSRIIGAWNGFWRALLAAALLFLLALLAYKFLPLSPTVVFATAAVAGGLVLAGTIAGAWRKWTLLDAARWVDQKQRLKERLSTALEVSSANAPAEWKQLVLADAAAHAREVDARRLLPFGLPRASRWALLALALCAGLGFVPEYRSVRFVQAQKDAENIRETGRALLELTRRALAEKPPVLPPTEKAMQQVGELGERLSQASLTRSEALHDLASAAEKLNQQLKQLQDQPGLKPLERAARESSSGGSPPTEALQKQLESMQKTLGNAQGTPEKLDQIRDQLKKAQDALANLSQNNAAAASGAREQISQALADAARQLKDMGESLDGLDEAMQALAQSQPGLALQELQEALTELDKLRDLAHKMKQAQQQMAKLGKDLAEQLENGQAQAAQQTLQKMVDQLQKADLKPEQLKQLTDEVSKAVDPAGEYGKVADHLKQAAQQMQKGEKGAAAQSLAQARQELDKLMKQMEDGESLLAAMEAVERAQSAISSGKKWSQSASKSRCKACQGRGCKACRGTGWNHGGSNGPAGVGTWADEEGGWTHLPDELHPVDNSGVQRPDMDGRGVTERPEDRNPNLEPDKVRGQFSKGGPMPSITLKGVHIKGQSNVKFEEAAATAQQDAQSALNQDQVPRAYQNSVRDYFDDLKK